MFLRIAITLQTAALLAAAITAGLLLTSPDGRPLHSAAAYSVFFAAVLYLAAAVLAWRPGGGPAGPVLSSVVFLGLTLAQVALGIAQMKALHVPLGVVLFGASVLLLGGTLGDRHPRSRPAPPTPPAQRRSEEEGTTTP